MKWAALFLAALAVAVCVATYVVVGLAWRDSRQPLRCVQWISYPKTYACDNGHSYVVQGRQLIDIGTRSPGGRLPAR